MSCPDTHEKLGYFAADIENLKKGHSTILDKMDKIEDKRDGQFGDINNKIDKQKWGLIGATFTAGIAPFLASSNVGQDVVKSLVVYIGKLFA